ncbi:hypothetical protein AX17_003134 [Amanita inopinata Kibby_2008]|nr:hypothetical protein AX17_003134 [Amanita inopinata Kibby_2008]
MSLHCSSDEYDDAGFHDPPLAGRSPSQSSQILPPPISNLPAEVLVEIFKHCTPILGDVSRALKDVAPLLLCRVCSSWRTLARSTPELWKSMTIHIPHILKDARYVTSFIAGWLGRSGTLPLAIYLNITSVIAKVHTKAILKILCQYASRWESVYIAYPNSPSVPFPLRETSHLPRLRSFYYVSGFSSSQGALPFTSAPRLTRLRWPGALSITEQPSIPWHQLTFVDCGELMGYAALEILQNCPELQEFIFGIGDWDSDTRLPCRPRVLHKRLRKLDLSEEQNSGPLLESLILPALDNLRFYSIYGPNDVPVQIVHQQLLCLLTRSKCTLDKLALFNSRFDSSMLLQCLQHESISNLTSLMIEDGNIDKAVTDDVLLQLTETPSGNQSLLLPKLTHLAIAKCVNASPGILGRMVWSRCCPSKKENRLKTFLFFGEYAEDDEDYIDRARRHGLEVAISDYDFDSKLLLEFE